MSLTDRKQKVKHTSSKSGGASKQVASLVSAGLISAVSVAALGTATFMSSSILTPAMAQDFTTGRIDGKVVDSSGSALVGTTVTLTEPSRGFSQTATTNADGTFRFARLALGNYVASVSSPEGSIERPVRVRAGAVQDLVLVLGVETAEEIVVTGSRTVSTRKDFQSQEAGLIVDADDLVLRVPLPRNITDVALLAPGATKGDAGFGNLPSFSGSSVAENAIYVNGFNITDVRTFLGPLNEIPFEFFQQFDIKTGGYQAEYGRSTGGVTNLVTRRGSNELSGGASFHYTPEGLRGENPDTTDILNSRDTRTTTETNVWLSGPIIEDRLFFYGLVSFQDDDIENFTNSDLSIREDNDPRYGLNIDAVLWDDANFGYHTLTYTHINDSRTETLTRFQYDREADAIGNDLGTTQLFRGGATNIVKYTGVVRDWLTLSVLFGDSHSENSSEVDLAFPGIRDQRSGSVVQLGQNTAITGSPVNNDGRRLWRADADVYLTDLLGDHSIRVGFDRETVSSANTVELSGGVLFDYFAADTANDFTRFGFSGSDFDDSEIARLTFFGQGGEFESIRRAFYVQDKWEFDDKLTFNLGFRLETFDNKSAEGFTFAKQSNLFDYRLGVTYDLFGDKTARVYGFAGTYHLPVANNTNARLAGDETFERQFFVLEGLNADNTPVLGQEIGTDFVSPGGIQNPVTLVSQNLTAQKQQEFILGYEQSFDNNWTFGARVIYRDLKDGLEDVAVDRGVLNFAEDNGLDVDAIAGVFSGFHQFLLLNPGNSAQFSITAEDAMSDPALFALLGGDPDGDGLVPIELTAEQLALPAINREYKALELTAERAFVDGWSVQASYVLSRSTGNTEGGVKSDNEQDDTGLTQDFDTQGLTEGTQGRLPNDRRHTFKFFGSYALTDTVTFGANLTLQSPRAHGCIGLHPTDDIAQQFGASSFFCPLDENNRPDANAEVRLTPRGSVLDTEWTKQLDVKMTITPDVEILGNLRPQFTIDVFNIFNTHDVTKRNEFGTFGTGAVRNTFGDPTDFIQPRTVRLNARLEF